MQALYQSSSIYHCGKIFGVNLVGVVEVLNSVVCNFVFMQALCL